MAREEMTTDGRNALAPALSLRARECAEVAAGIHALSPWKMAGVMVEFGPRVAVGVRPSKC